MKNTTTLAALIGDLEHLWDKTVIYAHKNSVGQWTGDSEATIRPLPGYGEYDDVPLELESGMKYFLEVSVARDVLSAWRLHHGGRSPSKRDKIEAVIYYAEHDSYIG